MYHYELGSCRVELLQGDITKSDTEAIANAASAMLMGGGGVDGAIHRAAGPELREALREVKRSLPSGTLPTGEAAATGGFRLMARYVIHCVGPIYSEEGERSAELLASCYRRALAVCRELELASITFPSISTGVYGYPVGEAAPVALGAIRADLEAHGQPKLCRFSLFDEATLEAYRTAAEQVLRP